MPNPQYETRKRISLAERVTNQFKDISSGIILTGSVAYAPNFNVTDKSDLDMLVIVEKLKESVPNLFISEEDTEKLKNRFFDGYCFKKDIEKVPVSIHLLSSDAFDIICKCFVADIRVFRSNKKSGLYMLRGFDGREYPYTIKNIPLEQGVRTIVPISFINKDKYFIGVHRDKLLSNPKVLYEKNKYISSGMDKLWNIVVENLVDESLRLHGKVDLRRRNILNTLAKKEKMNEDSRKFIKDKTNFYLENII